MELGRIETLSAFFALGVAAGALYCRENAQVWWESSLLCVMTFIAIPLIFKEKRRNTPYFALLYFFAGAMCFFSAYISSVYSTGEESFLVKNAEGWAEGLKNRIYLLGYKHHETENIVCALLTGERSGLSKETTRVFRDSGASHILALSGMHLGVIYSMLSVAMVLLGNRPFMRYIRTLSIIGLCGFYTLATGAGPSIVRAFIFISINEICHLFSLERRPGRVLCASLFIQLALNPVIIRSVGFQLSYAAMCGIIFLYPVLSSWYPSPEKEGKFYSKSDIPLRIWQAASLSISCQVFTAPIAWYCFHSFPKYFLITNLIAGPLSVAVVVMSIIILCLDYIGIEATFLLGINEKTVSALTDALTVISEM